MADAYITGGASDLGVNGLNSILTYFSDRSRFIKRNRFPVMALFNNDASEKIQEQGGVVNVPLPPVVSSYLLTDGSAVTKDNSVGTSVPITLNKQRCQTFGLTQLSQALDGNKTLQLEIDTRIAGLLNDVEADILSCVTSGFTNTVGAYNTNITEATWLAAMGTLYTNKVPPGSNIVGLVRPEPHAWQALAQIANFANAQNRAVGPGVMAMGNQAYGYGVPFHGAMVNMCQALPKATNNIDNAIFHPAAICVASRGLPLPLSTYIPSKNEVVDGLTINFKIAYDSTYQADMLHMTAFYGYGVGMVDWGINYKS